VYYNFPDDTIALPPKKLSDSKAKQFVDDWNNSVSIGPCKYFPNYMLTVYKKDNTQRQFKATGKNIKTTETDECFEIGGQAYFDKLWDNK
jgi:hypothetical protein